MASARPDRVQFDNYYDDQADVFDTRAGLPDGAAEQVADVLLDYAGVNPGDLLVEVGAGTGLIGQWLARRSIRYRGFDRSQPMLDVFLPRLPAGADATVCRADADGEWPVADGSATAIFGSRVLHWLRGEHVVDEAMRVARPGGAALVCGTVESSPTSPRTLAHRKVRELFAEQGLRTRPSGGRPTTLFAHTQALGAETLAPKVAATWPETISVTQVIDWWRGKTSLAGITPPPDVARTVMEQLTAWAAETFGSPPTPVTTYKQYVVEGVRIPSTCKES